MRYPIMIPKGVDIIRAVISKVLYLSEEYTSIHAGKNTTIKD
jgi:hypothetical protein